MNRTFQAVIYLVVYGAILVVFGSALMGCGQIGVSDSKHTVEGEATIRIEIAIASCDELEPAERSACVRNVTDALKAMQAGSATTSEGSK